MDKVTGWIKSRAPQVAGWAVAGLVLLFVALRLSPWRDDAGQAAALGARVLCSCRYVEGRAWGSCKGDLAGLPGQGMIHYSDDPAARSVTGSVPLLVSRGSVFKPGYGCRPEAR